MMRINSPLPPFGGFPYTGKAKPYGNIKLCEILPYIRGFALYHEQRWQRTKERHKKEICGGNPLSHGFWGGNLGDY